MYNYVDSSYARIVLDYGIVFTCVLLFGYSVSIKKEFDDGNYWKVVTLMFVLIWSFIEPNIINIGNNIFIILLIPCLEYGKFDIKIFNNKKSSKT